MEAILNSISRAVWGPPLISMLCFTGFFLTARSGFFQLRGIKTIWRKTFGSLLRGQGDSKSAFRAMTVALGGTIGIGNIAGVATAITIGGPGAVFWMWISGFLGMMTKYTEVALAVVYRRFDKKGGCYGGPMVYIEDGLGKPFRWMAVLFAVLCILSSFGIGNMTQSNIVAVSVEEAFHLPAVWTGTIFAAAVFWIVVGGAERILSFSGFFVPMMSAAYILIGCIVIAANLRYLPQAVCEIFSNAFGFRQAAGGAAGYTLLAAMRVGVSKGLFTNEAGAGSAPIAHAAAADSKPDAQGMWGIVEVFIDTIVVCSITAFAVLCSSAYRSKTAVSGISLTVAAFSDVLGKGSGPFIAVCAIMFSLASVVGWAFYGQASLRYLTASKKAALTYKIVFSAAIALGAVAAPMAVLDLADVLNGLMTLPNLLAILLLYPQALQEIGACLPRYLRRTFRQRQGREGSLRACCRTASKGKRRHKKYVQEENTVTAKI